MLKLIVTAGVLVLAVIGFYTLFPNTPVPEMLEDKLPVEGILLNADAGPFVCTKMACICEKNYTGTRDCNSCSGDIEGTSCRLKEVVVCENGKQIDTKYRVVSC